MNIFELQDRERGRPALVMGGGPSLLDINKDDYKDAVKIACNDYYRSDFYKDFKPDYWCVACSINTLMGLPKFGGEKILNHAIADNLILFIGIPRPNERDATRKYVDDLGYKHSVCFWDWGNFEIQQLLKLRYNINDIYSHGTSVIVHQIALAFWMGCNPISVAGIDLSYKAARERTGQTHAGFDERVCLGEGVEWFQGDGLQVPSTLDCIHSDFAYFGEIAKRNNIRLVNSSYKYNGLNIEGFINSDKV